MMKTYVSVLCKCAQCFSSRTTGADVENRTRVRSELGGIKWLGRLAFVVPQAPQQQVTSETQTIVQQALFVSLLTV